MRTDPRLWHMRWPGDLGTSMRAHQRYMALHAERMEDPSSALGDLAQMQAYGPNISDSMFRADDCRCPGSPE